MPDSVDSLDWVKYVEDDFVKEKLEQIRIYGQQLKDGKINEEQYKGYIRDLDRITQMEILGASEARKVILQKLAHLFVDLVEMKPFNL